MSGLDSLRPMERWRYLQENTAICTDCGETKKLNHFYNKQNHNLNDFCNKCSKIRERKEIFNIIKNLMDKEFNHF